MTLAIRPRPNNSELELSVSPYLDNSGELWAEGLNMLHRALYLQFKDADVSDYKFAIWLGVHRCIADDWLFALSTQMMVLRFSRSIVRSADANAASGFTVLPPKSLGSIKVTVPKELRDYDPWTERGFDGYVDCAHMPDLFIDKYYVVNVDECQIFERQRRKRPNGLLFNPIVPDEHPRYAHSTSTDRINRTTQVADPEWREIIDKAASEAPDED